MSLWVCSAVWAVGEPDCATAAAVLVFMAEGLLLVVVATVALSVLAGVVAVLAARLT